MISRSRLIECLALSLGLCSTLGMMLYASRGQLSLAVLAFMTWATLPYVLVYKMVSHRLVLEKDTALTIPAAINAMIMACSTISIYYVAIFRSQSATTAMVFLCWPVWLAVGTPVIFALCLRVYESLAGSTASTK